MTAIKRKAKRTAQRKAKRTVTRKVREHIHEKLGITFAEYGALLGVREMLKLRNLVHRPDVPTTLAAHEAARYVRKGEHGFNMSVSCGGQSCGSIACIGGSMGQIMFADNETADVYVRTSRLNADDASHAHSAVLHDLFFPNSLSSAGWVKITPRHAVKAIDNFLKDGNPRWLKVTGFKRY